MPWNDILMDGLLLQAPLRGYEQKPDPFFPKLYQSYQVSKDPKAWLSSTPLGELFNLLIPTYIPFLGGREAHHAIIGYSGSGKTSVLEWMLFQDLDRVVRNEASVVVIEPKGTLSNRITRFRRFVHGDLKGKLAYIQPSLEHPLGISLFDPGPLEGLSETRARALRSQAFRQLSYVFSALGVEATTLQGGPLTPALKLCSLVENANLRTLLDVLSLRKGDELPYADLIPQFDDSAKDHFLTVWNSSPTKARRQEVMGKVDAVRQASDFLDAMFSAPKTQINLYRELHEKSQLMVINTDEAKHERGWLFHFGRILRFSDLRHGNAQTAHSQRTTQTDFRIYRRSRRIHRATP